MSDSAGQRGSTVSANRGRRSWWQWVLGGGALLAAVLFSVMRMFPGLMPANPRGGPMIRISADLEASDRLTFDSVPGAGNLCLITLDTTRADRLGCYGNQDIETPNLDRLARTGAIFSNAYAPTPVTLPAHSTMMTGKYPYHHGARVNALTKLSDAQLTLAEVLSGEGYQTAAFVSAFVLDERFGIAQGFTTFGIEYSSHSEHWADVPDRPADETCAEAVAWLRAPGRTDQPFFLWVHFFDAHWQYAPPSPYSERYKDLLYDGEIAFMDSQIGRLLDALAEAGVSNDTLIVVAGDHGEGLGQHDEPTHGTFVYDSTLHVPLIFQGGPRLTSRGVRIDRPVGLIDIMPTVLSIMGIAAPADMDGVSLTQPQEGERTLYFDTLEGMAEYGWAPYVGAQQGFLKYIHGPEDELYDLSVDPLEMNNLVSSEGDRLRELEAKVADFYGGDLANAAQLDGVQQLSPEELAKLQALGYVFGGSADSTDPQELLNAKPMMRLMREVTAAFDPTADDWMTQGVERVEQIVSEHPDFYVARKELGVAYVLTGDLDAAEREFDACLELNPRLTNVKVYLAMVKARQGFHDEAITLYREVVGQFPDDSRSLAALGSLLVQRNEFEEAAAVLERAQAIMPQDPDVVMDLAKALGALGRRDQAMDGLQQALADLPREARLRSRLARMLRGDRRYEDAVAVLREGRALDPENMPFAANLAINLTEWTDPTFGRQREAIAILEQVNEQTDHSSAAFLHALGRAYASVGRYQEAVAASQSAQQLAAIAGQTMLAGKIDRDLASFIVARDRRVTGHPTDAVMGPAPENLGDRAEDTSD